MGTVAKGSMLIRKNGKHRNLYHGEIPVKNRLLFFLCYGICGISDGCTNGKYSHADQMAVKQFCVETGCLPVSVFSSEWRYSVLGER